MKNALILHGTDFGKKQKQRLNNWFPWLKQELETLGYKTWVPELPQAWEPDLNRYWNFLTEFDFNAQSLIIGHSSGAAMVFGLLHKIPVMNKINLAISVAGFYHDEGWHCQGLFSEAYNWPKIKQQAQTIEVIWSPQDPYIKQEQTDYLCKQLKIKPIIIQNGYHFNLEAGDSFHQFPQLLTIIKDRL